VKISHKNRFVFVSMPKAGTNTLYDILREHYEVRHVGRYHNRKIPPECRKWFTWSIVRNPFQRAISLWWRTVGAPRDQKRYFRFPSYPVGLVDFMYSLVAGERRDGGHLRLNQTDRLRGLRVDRVIHLETLGEEFKTLPFYTGQPEKWPHLNISTGLPDEDSILTPEALSLIKKWAGPDFNNFGYSTNPLSPHSPQWVK